MVPFFWISYVYIHEARGSRVLGPVFIPDFDDDDDDDDLTACLR